MCKPWRHTLPNDLINRAKSEWSVVVVYVKIKLLRLYVVRTHQCGWLCW
jgi:hypothetical protein